LFERGSCCRPLPNNINNNDQYLNNDEEWKVLEGAVDSQFGIGDPQWDILYSRGFNAGLNLKTTSGWYQNGNGTDLFGFSGLPGGVRDELGGFFYGVGYYGRWWSSTEYFTLGAWLRILSVDYPGAYRDYDGEGWGYSVRCLRDY